MAISEQTAVAAMGSKYQLQKFTFV